MTREARDIVVTGRVQGVGYRPFVYRTAHELGLAGTVLNGSGKVFIHAEGPAATLDRLERALVEQAPPLARPRLASSEAAALSGARTFAILASDAASEPEIHLPPDLFTCDDCLAELTGPAERRFAYPFINCTQCGPRYTIITAMPYDRPNTSMAGFPLCDACRAEYESPLDRRFHAQPLACAVCGPRLEFVPVGGHAQRPSSGASSPAAKPHRSQSLRLASDGQESRAKRAPTQDPSGQLEPADAVGGRIAADDGGRSQVGAALAAIAGESRLKPLQQTIAALDAGQVVAVKGVGGYHLLCDAANDAAVRRLRERKHRPHKPLAVMFPLRGADGLDAAREHLRLDALSAAALLDPARPIVLAPMAESFRLSPSLAPGLAELGAFLPYSPLHHELLAAFGRPLVATSGNISGEPVITANAEAQQRLANIADAFLHHDRPIVRPADDPVVRPMAGAARTLRLGRGLAPLELEMPEPGRLSRPLLATGGHLKVTVALAWDRRVVVSPHIGELDSPRSNDIFNQIIIDIQALYDVKSEVIICDRHPGYASSRWARQQGLPVLTVQHHAAHASALSGEHPDVTRWLIFAWDGVGYGDDGSLWGGEALAGRPGAWRRRASFRPFRLVGGDRAGREPWRSAAALLWAVGGRFAADIPDRAQSALLQLAHDAWSKNINTHESSAVGRLFDAAAALVLGRRVASFEGQGPMELEAIAADGCRPLCLPLAADSQGVLRSDWAPLVEMLTDGAMAPAERAGIFHESLAQALLDQALAIRATTDFDAVGLSGGVFQNRRLTERVVALLGQAGIDLRLHREVPANDGGLSFGQIIEAMANS